MKHHDACRRSRLTPPAPERRGAPVEGGPAGLCWKCRCPHPGAYFHVHSPPHLSRSFSQILAPRCLSTPPRVTVTPPLPAPTHIRPAQALLRSPPATPPSDQRAQLTTAPRTTRHRHILYAAHESASPPETHVASLEPRWPRPQLPPVFWAASSSTCKRIRTFRVLVSVSWITTSSSGKSCS